MNRSLLRTLTRTALCTALLCVLSLVRIPAPVPFTLTLFGVFFTLFFLGGTGGTLATALYLLLGLFGLPVFSQGGGPSAFLSPTGGYLVGLFALSLFYLLFTLRRPSRRCALLGATLGLLLCYGIGAVWYWLYTKTGLLFSLWVGVAPFVLFDALKLALAYFAAKRLRRLIPLS